MKIIFYVFYQKCQFHCFHSDVFSIICIIYIIYVFYHNYILYPNVFSIICIICIFYVIYQKLSISLFALQCILHNLYNLYILCNLPKILPNCQYIHHNVVSIICIIYVIYQKVLISLWKNKEKVKKRLVLF